VLDKQHKAIGEGDNMIPKADIPAGSMPISTFERAIVAALDLCMFAHTEAPQQVAAQHMTACAMFADRAAAHDRHGGRLIVLFRNDSWHVAT
jgi:hypothetical protein